MDTLGQVEKFDKKVKVSEVKRAERTKIMENRAAKTKQERLEKPTLKDLLIQARKKGA